MLRKAGYATQMIGKWHLGWDWHKDGNKIDFTKPVKNGPDINGFDGYYGHCGSLDMPPYVWVDTGKCTAVPKREEGVTSEEDPYGWYVRALSVLTSKSTKCCPIFSTSLWSTSMKRLLLPRRESPSSSTCLYLPHIHRSYQCLHSRTPAASIPTLTLSCSATITWGSYFPL